MTDTHPALLEWARRGQRWGEAILVKAQHSSPLPPGARLWVNEQGELHGAISMGCVESDIREHLLKALKTGNAAILHYGAADGLSLEVGLSCGGEIDVLIRVQDQDDVWRARAARDPAQPAILLTRITPPHAGSQQLLLRPGAATGTLGDAALDREAADAAAPLWQHGAATLLKLGDARVLAEKLAPPPLLALVGASPIAAALCRMAAMTGFRVAIVDPRKVYARAELFPDAAAVIHQWPEEGLKEAGIGAGSYVAVLAHDAKLDVPALATALRLGCRYVGLLGSRVTQQQRRRQLIEEGISADDLGRLRGPIGLDCGAVEPAEIAASILAELINERRGGPARGRSGTGAGGATQAR